MDEYELVMAFVALLDGDVEFAEWCDRVSVSRVQNFAQAQLMTNNVGFVLTLESGEEFQVRVVRSA